jgi:hypothetical protein
MRIRCLAVAVVAAAVVAGAAAAARDAVPQGTYSATVRGQAAALNGTWKLTFGPVIAVTGPLTVTRNGALAVAGIFTVGSGKLAFVDNRGPYACKGRQRAGLYGYSLNGKNLKLTLVADQCTGRRQLLSGRTFTGR